MTDRTDGRTGGPWRTLCHRLACTASMAWWRHNKFSELACTGCM